MKKVIRNLTVGSLIVGAGIAIYSMVKGTKNLVKSDIKNIDETNSNNEEHVYSDWNDVNKNYIPLKSYNTSDINNDEEYQKRKAM